jgi:RNA polymerase sigma-70 factor (ECF subfamily)
MDQLQSVAAKQDLEARVAATFDKELMEMALLRVKDRVAATTWEAFRLAALEGLAPQQVADNLGVRISQVYLSKHRVQKLVQEEIKALEDGQFD